VGGGQVQGQDRDLRGSARWAPAPVNYLTSAMGRNDMLAAIAGILIVLWLLGFFAFHVTSGMIHIVLVIGLIMLVLHFVTGRSVA
jgi:Family of unknown function (DUF5670)